ncbi:MAG TPA: hypothetical protein VI504_02020 [Candidatus Eisenbacteria bacterium]|jgi:hypothetical protein
MARIHRALALALASALSLLPALARADDPYADFRVPEHRTFSWILASNGGIQSTRQDERGAFRDRLANGHALSQMAWASETEARQLDLFLVADARWNDNHHRFDRQLPPAGFDHASARDRADAQSLTWLGDQRTYLGGSSFAVESQGSAALDFAQQGRSDAEHYFFTSPSLSTFEQFSGDDIESRLYRQAGFLSLGVGLGRVRDVTGVFSAQLIEHRLLATGRLTRALSPAALLRLAQLHYASSDFAAAHDRPSRYFWREVERVLREDGALDGGTLDAYSLERVLEPALGGVQFQRRRGSFVRPFFFGSESSGHIDLDERSSRLLIEDGVPAFSDASASSRRDKIDAKDSGAGLSAEYHRPAGMRWQSDCSLVTTYGGGPGRRLDIHPFAGVQYLIADRWFAAASLEENAHTERAGDGRTHPSWDLVGRANLSYLVEDSWTLDLQFTHEQEQERNGIFYFPRYFQRTSALTFGLTYRPFGRFAAPGLGLSEHLATPAL